MARTKQASKGKRARTALPVWGAAGMSLAMTGGAAAAVAPTANGPSHHAALPAIALGEEEISDVSLATFYVYDSEIAKLPLSEQLHLAARCGGCRGGGGRGCAARGCAGRGCAGVGARCAGVGARCAGVGARCAGVARCAVARCGVGRCGCGCGVGVTGCAGCAGGCGGPCWQWTATGWVQVC